MHYCVSQCDPLPCSRYHKRPSCSLSLSASSHEDQGQHQQQKYAFTGALSTPNPPAFYSNNSLPTSEITKVDQQQPKQEEEEEETIINDLSSVDFDDSDEDDNVLVSPDELLPIAPPLTFDKFLTMQVKLLMKIPYFLVEIVKISNVVQHDANVNSHVLLSWHPCFCLCVFFFRINGPL